MFLIRHIRTRLLLLFFLCQTGLAFGQLGTSFNIFKPKEFENRQLRSEKSDKGKFRFPKRPIQNIVTHYNFYFNANLKLQEVLEKAKAAFKDDYSQLLPFYNYTLEATAMDSATLDSVSYKSQTGLALHDLRNDWADNLYLLWGASYYFRQQFDSAYLMFQFINYAFAPKEKDGYYVNIGSRMDGNNSFSVVSKESKSLPKKLFFRPPSRNDAFIWQIRNYLAQDLFAEAASLIVTLRNDPAFPTRLNDDLEEVQAYWFYKQKLWDSAAVHLQLALGNATNKQEQARWEYLIAQLYELSGDYKQSESFYHHAISHTTDPILDIYARLFAIRVNKDGGDHYIENNIASLVKMARRDKYQDYRDIIYYMAAQMELERQNVDGALVLLEKSTQYTSNDPTLRNKAFLQLAELSFGKKLYRQSYNFYDSIRLDATGIEHPEEITKRKEILGRIATSLEVIDRQDSLQRIAALAEGDRKEFVRKLARQLRKQQGLKDESSGAGSGSFFGSPNDPPPLFSSSSSKGEWYFYNANSRQKGLSEFKAKWGSRPNQDNWRRSAASQGIVRANKTGQPADPSFRPGGAPAATEAAEITFDALYDRLPLTDEKKKTSNDSVQAAMFDLGIAYIQGIEDCAMGTETLEALRTRFPQHPKMDEVMFNLYYCYSRSGASDKAEAIRRLMNEQYSKSRYTSIVVTGKDPQDKSANTNATKTYEHIYDLFLEGNFAQALAEKKQADSLYASNYWNPQLLYIEAVYYMRQRQDSMASAVLNEIISKFPASPLSPRAMTMIDVLSRRAQIEEELRNLKISLPVEDTVKATVSADPPVTIPPPVQNPGLKKDTAAKAPVQVNQPGQPPRPATNDTASRKPIIAPPPVTAYVHTPEQAHFVVIILSKVDQVFVTEAKNAFANYNRNTFYNKPMTAELVQLDNDNRLLLLSPFATAQDAISYIDKTRPLAASQIVPWLTGGKYSFAIISEKNLELLKTRKDLDIYRQFLNQSVPGKF